MKKPLSLLLSFVGILIRAYFAIMIFSFFIIAPILSISEFGYRESIGTLIISAPLGIILIYFIIGDKTIDYLIHTWKRIKK